MHPLALLPHPPLLATELLGSATDGSAVVAAELREVCRGVVRDVLATHPSRVVLVGGGDVTRGFAPGTDAGVGGFGGPGPAGALPLPLAIGRRLLAEAGWDGPVVLQQVASDADAGTAGGLGRSLADDRAVLIALGDGPADLAAVDTAAHGARAEPLGDEAAVSAALFGADAAAVLRLGRRECPAPGRAAWQVLAGAAGAGPLRADPRYDAAPFGVRYRAVIWWPGA